MKRLVISRRPNRHPRDAGRRSSGSTTTTSWWARRATARRRSQLCLEAKPDIVVLDAKLPGLNGVDILRRLAKRLPNMRVLVFSGHENPVLVREMIEAGAHGFVEKTAGLFEFKKGLETVAARRHLLRPGRRGAAAQRGRQSRAPATAPTSSPTASGRSCKLVAESHSTKDIAAKLKISMKTVDNHRTNLMRKLNLHDVASLVRYAVDTGIIERNRP